jgi:thiamine monophosphate synthase
MLSKSLSIMLLIVNGFVCLTAFASFVEPLEGKLGAKRTKLDSWRPFKQPFLDKGRMRRLFGTHEASNFEPVTYCQAPTRTPATSMLFSSPPPYIAIVTEPDACDSEERWNATMEALEGALSTRLVQLVSVRLSRNSLNEGNEEEEQFQLRYTRMLQQLRAWSSDSSTSKRPLFHIVISSGPYMELGLRVSGGAHGVHFKEAHRSQIPAVREWHHHQYPDDAPLVVGTSVHSISSAIEAYQLYQPDYLFVGTCFATASHPDKIVLEGPALPGQVYDALNQIVTASDENTVLTPRPLTLAIGGVDAANCGAIVTRRVGPDGVAVIRSVLQAPDPAHAVQRIYQEMKNAKILLD